VLDLEYLGTSLGRKAPPTVNARLGRLSRPEYAEVLRDLARIEAARLVSNPRDEWQLSWGSTADFWASIRVARGEAVQFEDEWCGYPNGTDEVRYAKVEAAVARVLEAVREAEAAAHEPTAEERLWASRRFIRDWKRLEGLAGGYQWVRGRCPYLLASVGDDAALGFIHPLTVVHVRVRDADGSAVPWTSVQVCLTRSRLLRSLWVTTLPRPGDPTLSVLVGEPGEYELEVQGDGIQAKTIPVTVGNASPQEVVVEVDRVPGPR
ncbi:MAG TPA: hypothetical protein VKF62_03400, partial [Planctomycetota bacterium]|nr:hypothetical protein [Planctomycetota bacterium]